MTLKDNGLTKGDYAVQPVGATTAAFFRGHDQDRANAAPPSLESVAPPF